MTWAGETEKHEITFRLDPELSALIRAILDQKINPGEKWETRLKALEGRVGRLRSDVDSLTVEDE